MKIIKNIQNPCTCKYVLIFWFKVTQLVQLKIRIWFLKLRYFGESNNNISLREQDLKSLLLNYDMYCQSKLTLCH